MTGGRRRRQRRRRKASQATAATATHICSLGDDLVLQIFLRLPSLATLVRAACACRAWRRAVASSPASFRRRFRALHPAPLLLGVFGNPHRGGLPIFSPALHHRDRDVLAAVRGGDFCFTSLLEAAGDGDVPPRWSVSDCRDGHLVLMNWERGLVVVANPLAPTCPEYIALPYQDIVAGHCGRRRPVSLDVSASRRRAHHAAAVPATLALPRRAQGAGGRLLVGDMELARPALGGGRGEDAAARRRHAVASARDAGQRGRVLPLQ
ncbi:hypothetical protein ACP70R_037799 [Stipagrostis hirtigluma subsp. patula]